MDAPSGSRAAEELVRGRRADHAHLAALFNVALVEHAARRETPVVDDRETRDRSVDLRELFRAQVPDGGARLVHGNDALHARRLAPNRGEIALRQELRLSAARLAHAGNRRDAQEVHAERFELRDDGAARAFAEAHHRDERADADGQTEHRHDGSPGMPEHRAERARERLVIEHRGSRRSAGTTTAARLA